MGLVICRYTAFNQNTLLACFSCFRGEPEISPRGTALKKLRLYFFLIVSISLTAPASSVILHARQDVTIHASRNASGTQIDIIPLSDADRQTKTLSDILSERVGVQIKKTGSDGGYSSVYVRGTNANQLVVCIDGIAITDIVYGETNFENIPVGSIDRIEIYRSFAPVSFSQSGIGGIINLVTKKGRGTTETGIAAGAGSFLTGKLSLFHSLDKENDQLLLTGNASAGKGDFTFKNDNGTSFNTDDDFTDTRKNNSFKHCAFTARYAHKDGDLSMNALSDTFIKSRQIASYNNKASHAKLDTARTLNNVKLGFDNVADLPLSAELSAFASLRRSTYDDLKNEIGLFAEKTTDTVVSFGAQGNAEYRAAALDQIISISLESQSESYYLTRNSNEDKSDYPAQRRMSARIGLEDSVNLFERRITITPQIRTAAYKDRASESTRGSAARYSADPGVCAALWPVKNLAYIRGTWQKKHRAPSFSELFGNRGTVKGNPDLKDEASTGYDASAGIEYNDFSSNFVQAFGFEYTYFNTHIRNIIVFFQNSQYTMVADNISAADITGHEFTAHVAFLDHIDVSFNQTIQFAKDDSDIPYYRGNYLPFRPVFETNAALKLFNSFGSVTYELSRTGSNFRDRANSELQYINRRVSHSASVQVSPVRNLIVMLTVRNITDNRTMDVAGYPLPGRTFTGSVQYTF